MEEVQDGIEGEEAEEVEEVEEEEEEVEEAAEKHKCIDKFLGKMMIFILKRFIKIGIQSKLIHVNSVLWPFSLMHFRFCNAFLSFLC